MWITQSPLAANTGPLARPRAGPADCIHVLVSERTIDVPWQAARARLANLAEGGGLARVSHTAYQHGLTALMRVGPLGDLPGASKLVAVRFLEPVDRGDRPTAGLFPVRTPTSSSHPTVTTAPRWPSPAPTGHRWARPGAGLDKGILHRVATATIRALLAVVAGALTSPAIATQGHTAPALRPGPATGTSNP